MKKVVMMFAAVIFTMTVSAQVKVGFKGGLSFANGVFSEGTSSETYSTLTRTNFGITLDFPSSGSVSIQSGLMFNGMGAKFVEGNETVKLPLNYLSVPVLAKLKFGSGFYGYAGPQLSLLLSAKVKYDGGTEDFKNEMKGSSLFGIFGLGYSVSEKFSLHADYAAGLTDLSKVSTNGSKWTANAFSIGVGIGLN
jgi:hypothetical protein